MNIVFERFITDLNVKNKLHILNICIGRGPLRLNIYIGRGSLKLNIYTGRGP